MLFYSHQAVVVLTLSWLLTGSKTVTTNWYNWNLYIKRHHWNILWWSLLKNLKPMLSKSTFLTCYAVWVLMSYSTIAKHSIKSTTMDTSKINRVHLALYLSACASTLIIFSTPILSLPDIKQKKEKKKERRKYQRKFLELDFASVCSNGAKHCCSRPHHWGAQWKKSNFLGC